MRLISFRSTVMFKRGIALSAAMLAAVVLAPALSGAAERPSVLGNIVSLALLGLFSIYVLAKTHLPLLADEVADGGDHLRVQRGRTVMAVPLADIGAVTVASGAGLHRIVLDLAAPTPLGQRIEFLPQASLWSNHGAIVRAAASLAQRAEQARGARGSHPATGRAPRG